jgi:DNA-binding XRE family transcriptional regulator
LTETGFVSAERPVEWGDARLLRGGTDVSVKPGTHPNRVRELREDRLMTQAQLARRAKVALRTIHSVEKGMNCRMDTKRKILLALGLRFEDKDQVFPSRRSLAHPFGVLSAASSPPPAHPLSAGAQGDADDSLS